jgi:hypothetical protein
MDGDEHEVGFSLLDMDLVMEEADDPGLGAGRAPWRPREGALPLG